MNRIVIAAVDASRARLFTFEQEAAPPGHVTQQLREEADLVHPARRIRPSELFSDSRPGLDRAPSGRAFAVNDRREASLRHMDRRFAGDVAAAIELLISQTGAQHVILAASPAMLGLLRELIGPMIARGISIDQLDRDLVRFTRTDLQDLLADKGLMPPRERITAADATR
jgi:protein required for attachment to host cells